MNQPILDFTKPLKAYDVISDATERELGKSHGDLSYQNGIQEKKHYFFAFLDPQPNGAGFVSLYTPIKLALKPNQTLCLTAKGLQESSSIFQIIISTSTSKKKHFSYQQPFKISDQKTTLHLPLKNFSASYRGKPVPEAPRLDTHDIQSIGIRITGRNQTPSDVFQSGLYGLALYQLSVCDA